MLRGQDSNLGPEVMSLVRYHSSTPLRVSVLLFLDKIKLLEDLLVQLHDTEGLALRQNEV